MKKIMRTIRLNSLTACALIGGAALLASQVQAQAVYRLVGPDGKVSFSDKAPTTADKATATGPVSQPGGNGGAALPFELRQIANKFPVTLYTADKCAPCASGRGLLSTRGIPFTEKTVNTNEDIEALQRISSESSLPFLTIGGQHIRGFSDSEWTQFLDAAGYPKSSALPANYRKPAATPLVAIQKQKPAAKPEEDLVKRAPTTPIAPPIDTKSNPAGISF